MTSSKHLSFLINFIFILEQTKKKEKLFDKKK